MTRLFLTAILCMAVALIMGCQSAPNVTDADASVNSNKSNEDSSTPKRMPYMLYRREGGRL